MKSKSFQDLEKELLKKNEDLTNKFLELETLLDLTNTINSQEDLKSLFFNILTISSSVLVLSMPPLLTTYVWAFPSLDKRGFIINGGGWRG